MTGLDIALGVMKNPTKVLLRHGLVNIKLQSWRDIFSTRSEDSIRKIIENGLDPNLTDKEGQSALVALIDYDISSTHMLDLLLAHGADPQQGLIEAIKLEKTSAVISMLDVLNLDAISSTIPTAMEIASKYNNVEILELLINRVIDWQCSSTDLLSQSDLERVAKSLGFEYTSKAAFCEKMVSLPGTLIKDCQYKYKRNLIEEGDEANIKEGTMRDYSAEEIEARRLRYVEAQSDQCQIEISESSTLPARDTVDWRVPQAMEGREGLIKFAAKFDDLGKPIIVLGHQAEHHSNIFGHKTPVVMAGYIAFRGNKIRYIDNNSGHFQFSKKALICFVQRLRQFYPKCLSKDFYYLSLAPE